MIIVLFVISVANLFLLLIGNYQLLKKLLTSHQSKSLALISTPAVSAAIISFCYYITLMLRLDFWAVLLMLTAINVIRFFFPRINRLTINSSYFKLSSISIEACCALLLFTFFFVLNADKYGGSDAWGIWNVHAKFLYYPKVWTNLITGGLTITHPDYPLMIPSLVAFGWHCLSNISFIIPLLLAYFVFLSLGFATYKALKDQGLRLYGYIALAMLLTTSALLQVAVAQESDMLLSVFFLLTFIAYTQSVNSTDGTVYLLGFICASCGWIKNEGLAFVLVFSLVYAIANYRNLKSVGKFLAGAAIPLVIIISFKIFYAPANDLVDANRHISPIAKLTDISRYIYIAKTYVTTLAKNYPAAYVLMAVMLIYNRKIPSLPTIVITLLLCIYFFVYILSPYSLEWHTYTSLSRLYEQVYPSFIYICFISLKKNGVLERTTVKPANNQAINSEEANA